MTTMRDLRHALEVVTSGSEGVMPEAMRAEAADAQQMAKPWTMGEGIEGIGIAQKTTNGVVLDQLALKVYVEKKKPERGLRNMIPAVVTIPGLDQPIVTDVEEIGKVTLESSTTRVRPAFPGISVGHVDITAGTFGCLVRKKGDPHTLYILSNSHVLADEGVGHVGDAVIQQGTLDGGHTPADRIATLSEFVPFQFTALGFPNLVDTAIAKVLNPADVTKTVPRIGVPVGISTFVRRGMRVQKTGRTTDYTQGMILDVDFRTSLLYKKPGGGTGRAGFQQQVLCTRYTAGGDSGSAIFNMSGKVVGLHFAGSPSSSIFNRIRHVVDALQVEVVT